MATKFAHRAACHEDSYWQSAEGDARSVEEIVEGTVNTAWIYHGHPALLLLPSQDRLLNVFMHHFNSTLRFYHVAAFYCEDRKRPERTYECDFPGTQYPVSYLLISSSMLCEINKYREGFSQVGY
jgi:hypothetical protein